ncbi:MAG: hypothetical protein KDB99_16495, partial [Chitinophagaceae bacterium]|nr:hypothetical protein [Chitinophagaceae bacterium]
MRPNLIPRYFLILALVAASFFSCNEKEVFTSEAIESYIPLQQGKYIVFRLDSLVFTNFGRTIETHRYQEMHEVDTLITDNLGRPSYRIFVYQRDSLGTTPWAPVSTYFITPLGNQFEKVENNLRFISMHLPLRDGYSWKGNKYLPTNPYGTLYNFSNDDNMGDWDYYYDGDPG